MGMLSWFKSVRCFTVSVMMVMMILMMVVILMLMIFVMNHDGDDKIDDDGDDIHDDVHHTGRDRFGFHLCATLHLLIQSFNEIMMMMMMVTMVDPLQTYNVGHTDKLTGVIHTEGAIYTSSNDKTVKVLEPSRDPAPITTLEKHNSGVAGVCYTVVGWQGCVQ